MSKPVQQIILGVDVSKATLDIANDEHNVTRIDNAAADIGAFLDGYDSALAVAVEPTGGYQDTLVAELVRRGHTVYLVNPQQLVHYRRAIGQRSKNDVLDAQLLQRFATHEQHSLRPLKPLSRQQKRLAALLRRRAVIVRCEVRIRQSFARADDPALAQCLRQYKAIHQSLLKHIDQALRKLIRALGLEADVARCRTIPGIGPLNAWALTMHYHRGNFSSSDAFVAYLGLDVREKKSGRFQGREHISKQGDREARRLLYNAAMAASRQATFMPYYQRCLQRGMSAIQALVALARKLVRIAFSLLRNQCAFSSEYRHHTCRAT